MVGSEEEIEEEEEEEEHAFVLKSEFSM